MALQEVVHDNALPTSQYSWKCEMLFGDTPVYAVHTGASLKEYLEFHKDNPKLTYMIATSRIDGQLVKITYTRDEDGVLRAIKTVF